MNEVLGGGFSGRLVNTIRTKKGLAYSVSGGLGAAFDRPGPHAPRHADEIRVDLRRDRGAQGGGRRDHRPTPRPTTRWAAAKESILNSFIFNYDSRAGILAQQMTYAYYGLPSNYLEMYRANIEKVTKDDVVRVAKKYVHLERPVDPRRRKGGGLSEAARHARQGDDAGHHDPEEAGCGVARRVGLHCRATSSREDPCPSSRDIDPSACCSWRFSSRRHTPVQPGSGRPASSATRWPAGVPPTRATTTRSWSVTRSRSPSRRSRGSSTRLRNTGASSCRRPPASPSTPTSTSSWKPTTSRRPIWGARPACAIARWASTGARSSTGCVVSRSTTPEFDKRSATTNVPRSSA